MLPSWPSLTCTLGTQAGWLPPPPAPSLYCSPSGFLKAESSMSALKPCRDQTGVDPGHPQDGAAESRGRAMSKEVGQRPRPLTYWPCPLGVRPGWAQSTQCWPRSFGLRCKGSQPLQWDAQDSGLRLSEREAEAALSAPAGATGGAQHRPSSWGRRGWSGVCRADRSCGQLLLTQARAWWPQVATGAQAPA